MERKHRTIFVVSDLHLGGRPADEAAGDAGFQMCSATGQARLAKWVGWCTRQLAADRRAEIVIAGDIVDFLAEEPFSPFTPDDDGATAKLKNILHNTAPIWDSLRAFVAAGGELTLMLGNHDVELSLPGPRRLLLDRLGRGTSPRFVVDFIDDNRARVEGPVLIEHGNRYDPWNAVPHGDLRRMRSAASRRETIGGLVDLDMPGSHLVTRVMNDIKRQYRFVDLLKPERSGALPILAALDPSKVGVLHEVALLAAKATLREKLGFDADTGAPTGGNEIAADPQLGGWSRKKATGDATNEATEAAVDPDLELADALAGERIEATPTGEIGTEGLFARFADLTEGQLYRALRRFAESHHLEYAVTHEDPLYLKPASVLAAKFEVVVFGHTHLAKRIPIKGTHGVYLNTGTWADLMRLPTTILTGADSPESKADLKIFAHDLRTGDLRAHIRQLPTFARIDIGPDGKTAADVLLFRKDGSGAEPIPAKSLWEIWDDYA